MEAVTGRARRAGSRLDSLVAAADSDRSGLVRSLGPVRLAALGVATIVGAGIFVLTGEAAASFAGPGIAISFALAGVAAGLSALCYAELASMIPVTGSTYSYAYAVLGPFLGWVIGWDLLLEYLMGGATVAVGWSGYLVNVLDGIGVHLPGALVNGPFDGGTINLPAVVLVALVTGLLVLGTRESANVTTALVAAKVTVLLMFVVIGALYVKAANYSPLIPENRGSFGVFGLSGVVRAAGAVFFAYIGFDLVCTAAQEARRPRRTVPVGLLSSLLVATLLYVAVAFVLTGLVSYRSLDVPDPLAVGIAATGHLGWLRSLIDVAAVGALAATVLAVLYGQARILMRMSQDGMLPVGLSRVSRSRGTPVTTTLVCGALAATIAAFFPIETLGNLISIGTLAAFILVAVAIVVLRRIRPEAERTFRVPFGLVVPVASVVVSLGVALTLPALTLARFAVWLVIGLVIYFAYARRRAASVAETRMAA